MKVVCCTMFSPSHNELANISVPNLREYSERYGYEVRLIMVENDKWEYQKHEAFVRYFKEDIDLIWYKDIDTIITNMTMPITGFIDDENSFFITKDFNELNGGSVIIANTYDGRTLNYFVLRRSDQFQNEQNVYNVYHENLLDAGMKVLHHPSINSYKYDLYPECKDYVGREDLGDWKEGNFVLHVPALPLEKRLEVLKNATIIR